MPSSTCRADRLQHLAELGLRPDGAEHAGRGPDHGNGLVAELVRGERARDPVEAFFSWPGSRRCTRAWRREPRRRRRSRSAAPRRPPAPPVRRRPRRRAGSPSGPPRPPARRPRRARPRPRAVRALWESRRRLPEMPRIVIASRPSRTGARRRSSRRRRGRGRRSGAACSSRCRSPSGRPSCRARSRRARSQGSLRAGNAPVTVTGFVTPFSVISPSTLTVSPSRAIRSAEAQLGVPLGVEEVGRLQVRCEVLVLDVDARDLGRAGQARRRPRSRAWTRPRGTRP